jgi:hypothetical protein
VSDEQVEERFHRLKPGRLGIPLGEAENACVEGQLSATARRPKLNAVRLGWVNFHVTRRTHSSLMKDNNVDSKVVAGQLGNSLDVNLNVYA